MKKKKKRKGGEWNAGSGAKMTETGRPRSRVVGEERDQVSHGPTVQQVEEEVEEEEKEEEEKCGGDLALR